MTYINLSQDEVEHIWAPFSEWMAANFFPNRGEISIWSTPGNEWWVLRDVDTWKVPSPYDPSEPDRAYFTTTDKTEVSKYTAFYGSRYITSGQLADSDLMASHLMELARSTHRVELHTN